MKALAIAASNLRRFTRDRANVFFVLILPMLLILVLGSVFGRGFDLRVGLVVPGSGDLATAMVEALEAHEAFVVHRHDDRDTVIRAVERGELEAGLIIPSGYDEAIRAGRRRGDRFHRSPRPGFAEHSSHHRRDSCGANGAAAHRRLRL